MKILIIILIVLMVVEMAVYIYAQFIDMTNRRQQAAFQEQMKSIQIDFLNEKHRFQTIIDEKDKQLKEAIQNWKIAALRVKDLEELLKEAEK